MILYVKSVAVVDNCVEVNMTNKQAINFANNVVEASKEARDHQMTFPVGVLSEEEHDVKKLILFVEK